MTETEISSNANPMKPDYQTTLFHQIPPETSCAAR